MIWLSLAWGGPTEIAVELLGIETRLRDTTLTDLRADGMRQQQLYRSLAGNTEAQAAVLEACGGQPLCGVLRSNLEAGDRIAHTVTNLKSTVPAWRIQAPEPVDTLLGFYREAEEASGVPWEVLAAIHLVETRMGRLVGTSWAGASGPMQFMPATWKAYGKGDVLDPHDAILGAGNYLAKMGASKDLDKAIWHYNHSNAYVRSVRGYAAVLEQNPLAYRGYHSWQVYYRTTAGVVILSEGYQQDAPIPVTQYCKESPESCP